MLGLRTTGSNPSVSCGDNLPQSISSIHVMRPAHLQHPKKIHFLGVGNPISVELYRQPRGQSGGAVVLREGH